MVKTWHQVKWKDIKVSDIVKVASDELFPCDLLFLSSRFAPFLVDFEQFFIQLLKLQMLAKKTQYAR